MGRNKTSRSVKGKTISVIGNKNLHRLLICMLTFGLSFLILYNGALPKQYKLREGDISHYDIAAPRDVENRMKTEERALNAAKQVPPVVSKSEGVSLDVLNSAESVIALVEDTRKSILKSLEDQGISKRDKVYQQRLKAEQQYGATRLSQSIQVFDIPLSTEQVYFLAATTTDQEIGDFKRIVREALTLVMREDITEEGLPGFVTQAQDKLQQSNLNQEMKNIGSILVKTVMKSNSTVDDTLTQEKRDSAYQDALKNKVMIPKNSRIVSMGDLVTEDKLQVLAELNLLETGKPDLSFLSGLLTVMLLLMLLLLLYMNHFYKKNFHDRSDLILLSVIIVLTLLLARVIQEYSYILIPILVAPMLISILLDLRLAVVVNGILAVSINFMTQGDMAFLYMALISGTFAAFLVSKATQRSRLSMAGIMVAGINVLIIVCFGIINKNEVRLIAEDSLKAFLNGIFSIVFTIGLLPFLESTFGIITAQKLLELTNPDQPLLKRLLLEAPGTYHHSLMVGNLAEVATEAIGGNALLSRVGAYYHDVGKLEKPGFFKENQLLENPHDRMAPNLSTLVITSHTRDGVVLAEKYKLPQAVRDIIQQHHGTTMVAYFYHKALQLGGDNPPDPKDFRYQGPKPLTKEAAVVLLADSVEAAVRSMTDRTEKTIEVVARKIVKDKMEDGQLDLCSLTLKDLDDIVRSFLRVFSGYFHGRVQYPEMNGESRKTELPEETQMEIMPKETGMEAIKEKPKCES